MKIDYVRELLTGMQSPAWDMEPPIREGDLARLTLALLDYYEVSRKYGQYPDELDADEAVERRMEEL